MSIHFSESFDLQKRLLVILKIASYHPKSCLITSFISECFEFESQDSPNNSSSKFLETSEISCLYAETSESLWTFPPREILLSVITTKADRDKSKLLRTERYRR